MMRKKINGPSQRGFTMVEILVSMAIGLLLMTGIIQIYVSNQASARMQEGLGRMQENARFALYQLERDVRMASFIGCPQRRLEAEWGRRTDDLDVGIVGGTMRVVRDTFGTISSNVSGKRILNLFGNNLLNG